MSTFIAKLLDILSTADPTIVAWEADGNSFKVFNSSRFSKEVLARHFKSSQFSSFIRQLNFYGFHKQMGAGGAPWQFRHANFVRGRTDLMAAIKRKTSNEYHQAAQEELERLRKEVKTLHATVDGLRAQLATARHTITTLQNSGAAAAAAAPLDSKPESYFGDGSGGSSNSNRGGSNSMLPPITPTAMFAESPQPAGASNKKRRRTKYDDGAAKSLLAAPIGSTSSLDVSQLLAPSTPIIKVEQNVAVPAVDDEDMGITGDSPTSGRTAVTSAGGAKASSSSITATTTTTTRPPDLSELLEDGSFAPLPDDLFDGILRMELSQDEPAATATVPEAASSNLFAPPLLTRSITNSSQLSSVMDSDIDFSFFSTPTAAPGLTRSLSNSSLRSANGGAGLGAGAALQPRASPTASPQETTPDIAKQISSLSPSEQEQLALRLFTAVAAGFQQHQQATGKTPKQQQQQKQKQKPKVHKQQQQQQKQQLRRNLQLSVAPPAPSTSMSAAPRSSAIATPRSGSAAGTGSTDAPVPSRAPVAPGSAAQQELPDGASPLQLLRCLLSVPAIATTVASAAMVASASTAAGAGLLSSRS